jgi:hypothetical protein
MKSCLTPTFSLLLLALSGCQICFHGDGPADEAPAADVSRSEDTPACRARADCAAGRDCVNARCLDRCNVNGDCPGSLVCAAGYCVRYVDDVMPSDGGDAGVCDASAACVHASDCPAGRACINARCVPAP